MEGEKGMETTFVLPALARSVVYRKLPIGVRCRLDRLILLRPKNCATEAAMAKRLRLAEGYGVSTAALRGYVRRFEQYLRPVVASQLTVAVLGALPAAYRRQIADGGQVVLLGKVVQALTDPRPMGSESRSEALSVADLSKLAAVLRAIRPPDASGRAGRGRGRREAGSRRQVGVHDAAGSFGRLGEVVRRLYGLDWPPPSGESQQGRGEAGQADENALAGGATGQSFAPDAS